MMKRTVLKFLIESSFAESIVAVGQSFLRLLFIARDVRYAFANYRWDLFNDRWWVVRLLLDVK